MVVTLLPLLTASNAIISAAFAKAISAFCSIIFGSNIFRALNATCATVFFVFVLLWVSDLAPDTILVITRNRKKFRFKRKFGTMEINCIILKTYL